MPNHDKVLTRSKHGILTGTLRGLAQHFGLNLNRLQLFFIIAAFFGIGFVIYFVLWISIPSYSQREILLADLKSKHE